MYKVICDLGCEDLIGFTCSFIRDGSTFVQALAMGSVQFCGFVKTSMLPPLSPDLAAPPARKEVDLKTGEEIEATLSLAAGMLCGVSLFVSVYKQDKSLYTQKLYWNQLHPILYWHKLTLILIL